MQRYATGLDFEHSAATIVEARAAANAVLRTTQALLNAISAADDDRMDRLITNRAQDKWELTHNHGFTFDYDQERMVADIANRFSGGEDPPPEWCTNLGWELVRGWTGAQRLVRPAPAADFVVTLQEFQQAFGLVAKDLKQEGKEADPHVPAWMQFVVDVREWAQTHGYPAWAGNNDSYENHGPIVYLIKRVNELLPERHRRPAIKDSSLASSIQDAWQGYKSRAEKRDKLRGETA